MTELIWASTCAGHFENHKLQNLDQLFLQQEPHRLDVYHALNILYSAQLEKNHKLANQIH